MKGLKRGWILPYSTNVGRESSECPFTLRDSVMLVLKQEKEVCLSFDIAVHKHTLLSYARGRTQWLHGVRWKPIPTKIVNSNQRGM